MKLAWINSTIIKKGFRYIKTKFGENGVEETKTAQPFGLDSNPTKGYLAIIAETMNNDAPVVVGYLDPKALSSLAVGESQTYAIDSDGKRVATITHRKDGKIEMLGVGDNMLRFTPLDTALKTFADAMNAQLKLALAPVPYTWVDVPLDISASKIAEIKTP